MNVSVASASTHNIREASKLRFGTFNLLNFTAPPGASYQPQFVYKPKDWAKKCAWVGRQLSRMDADVVGFQEVFSPQTLQTIAAEAGYSYFATVDQPRIKHDLVYDRPVLAIASKHPIQQAEVLAYDPARSGLPIPADFTFSRSPLLASIDLPAIGCVQFVVLHLKSPRALLKPAEIAPFKRWCEGDQLQWPSGSLVEQGYTLSTWQRVAEAGLVYQAVQKQAIQKQVTQAQVTQPVVVMGDLNDDLQSVSGQALLGKAVQLTTTGAAIFDHADPSESLACLVDAAVLAEQSGKGKIMPTYYHRREPLYLDHILLNQAMLSRTEISEYKVMNRHLSRNYAGSIRKSDHAQVVLELSTRITSDDRVA